MEINNFSKELFEVKIIHYKHLDDERGSFSKIFSEKNEELLKDIDEVYFSDSEKNVIRGVHLQKPPYELTKIVTCLEGEIIDFFIDLRYESKTYGKSGSVNLQKNDNCSILIPPGFGHGFSVLSTNAKVMYMQNGIYKNSHELGINPLSVDFDWKVENPIISERDLSLPNFSSSKIGV